MSDTARETVGASKRQTQLKNATRETAGRVRAYMSQLGPRPGPNRKWCGLRRKRNEVDGLVAKWRRKIEEEGIKLQVEPEYEYEGLPTTPFVDKPWFNWSVGLIISINAIVVGMEVDEKMSGRHTPGVWNLLNFVFLTIYTVELFMRLYFHGWGFFDQPGMVFWNNFDFFLVITNWGDTLIFEPAGINVFGVMPMLRFARAERLIRLIKLLQSFKELRLVSYGLIQSFRIYVWICVLCFGVMYGMGIFMTDFVGSARAGIEVYESVYKELVFDNTVYFATILKSVLTLCQLITLEEGIDSIVRPIRVEQPGVSLFVTIFVVLLSFGLFNTMVAVVVDAILHAAEQAKMDDYAEKHNFEKMMCAQLEAVFRGSDKDGNGELDVNEIKEALNDPEIYYRMMQIDFPVEDVDAIFKVLDFDNSGQLAIEEFLDGCMRMRGFAQSKDTTVAQLALSRTAEWMGIFEAELDKLGEKIDVLASTATAIVNQGEQVFLTVQEYRSRHKDAMSARQRLPTIRCSQLDLMPWEAPGSTGLGDEEPADAGQIDADDIEQMETNNINAALEDFFQLDPYPSKDVVEPPKHATHGRVDATGATMPLSLPSASDARTAPMGRQLAVRDD